MAEKGWISKEAMAPGALENSVAGRAVMDDGFVNAAKLDAAAVETAKIKDLNVTTGKLNDLAVTEGKIGASAVTTGKVADSAVTAIKTSGVVIPDVLGAPSVEAGGLDDVLSAVALPAAATNEVLAATALPAAATTEVLILRELPAAATDEVHAAITLADGSTTEVTTAITNPPSPRTLAILGNAAGITGNVVIVGTDEADQAANDTIAANGTAKVYGVQIFKTVTSITVPARNAENDTIAVGIGRALTLSINNPATPRVLAIKGNAAGITGNVTIVGTDEADQAANEDIAASGTDKVYGSQIFKTVTSVTLPPLVTAGDKISVGIGAAITYGISNPDVPRTLAIKGSAAGITGNVAIVGTDEADQAANETIVAVDDTKVYGTQIFKTVTSITLPPLVTALDTIAVGIGRDITYGITDPDITRSLGVVGNQAGVAGDVVITGTNYSDAGITETIVAADNTKVYGAKAFKTVTSIRVPALVGAGDTVAVGLGNKLGLPRMLAAAGQVVFALLNRAVVAPTVAVDADEIEKNTVDLSAGTYNGAKVAVAMIYR